MRTFDELETAWQALPPPPRERGIVRLVVLRKGNGVHEVVARGELSPERGLHGDRWALAGTPDPACQVTLMSVHAARVLAADVLPLDLPGDNVLVDLDVGEEALPVGSRVRLGTSVLEVTPLPHMGCQKFSARFGQDALRWVNWRAHRARRLRGVNCRVVEAGVVAPGEAVMRIA